VLHVHVPTRKLMAEKLGFTGAGIGVLSTWAPAGMMLSGADRITIAPNRCSNRILVLLNYV
jgi:hypothetical protein